MARNLYKNGINDFTTKDWMNVAYANAIRGQGKHSAVASGYQTIYDQMYADALYMKQFLKRDAL